LIGKKQLDILGREFENI